MGVIGLIMLFVRATREHGVRYRANSVVPIQVHANNHGVCIPHRIPRVWEQQGVKQEEEADTRAIAKEE